MTMSFQVLRQFMKLYLMTSVSEWVKVTVLDFSGNFTLSSKLGKRVIIWPRINNFQVLCKLVH